MRGPWAWLVAVVAGGRKLMQESRSRMAAPQRDEP
jgi:hypothetical protein